MALKPKTYIGDSVYAEVDEFGCIVLTTENGSFATNRIVIEPRGFETLLSWLDLQIARRP